jgi:hypothetical protein
MEKPHQREHVRRRRQEGSATWDAVVPLVTLVPVAMLIYIGLDFYATR